MRVTEVYTQNVKELLLLIQSNHEGCDLGAKQCQMQSFPPEGLPLKETTKSFHIISLKVFTNLVPRGTSIQEAAVSKRKVVKYTSIKLCKFNPQCSVIKPFLTYRMNKLFFEITIDTLFKKEG